ncbi:unnamed protein product, partial [Prorocentrum cordatum]
ARPAELAAGRAGPLGRPASLCGRPDRTASARGGRRCGRPARAPSGHAALPAPRRGVGSGEERSNECVPKDGPYRSAAVGPQPSNGDEESRSGRTRGGRERVSGRRRR